MQLSTPGRVQETLSGPFLGKVSQEVPGRLEGRALPWVWQWARPHGTAGPQTVEHRRVGSRLGSHSLCQVLSDPPLRTPDAANGPHKQETHSTALQPNACPSTKVLFHLLLLFTVKNPGFCRNVKSTPSSTSPPTGHHVQVLAAAAQSRANVLLTGRSHTSGTDPACSMTLCTSNQLRDRQTLDSHRGGDGCPRDSPDISGRPCGRDAAPGAQRSPPSRRSRRLNAGLLGIPRLCTAFPERHSDAHSHTR